MQPDNARAADAARGAFAAEAQRLCGQLDTIAGALHDTAAGLAQRNEATAARYVDTAAEKLHTLTQRMQGRDPAQLLQETGRYAREQPGAFFTAAVAAGVLLSRFMKASQQSPRPDELAMRGAGTPYSPTGQIDDPDAYLTNGGI